MVWLYVPGLEDSNKELNESLIDAEPFVMWRGKPIRPQSLRNKWNKGGFIKRLSGLTCDHSMADRGVKSWISSQRDSHASHSAKLESKKGQKMKGTYGPKLSGSLAKLNLQSSSWKTSQTSLISRERLSLQIWPKWGIVSDGELFGHQTPKHLIDARGGSVSRFIPTPTCMDSSFQGKIRTQAIQSNFKRGVSLPLYVRLFPTPTASMMPCEGTVRLMRKRWLDGTVNLEEANAIARRDVRKAQGNIPAMFPTPTATANQACESMRSKGASFENLPNGKLNPNWIEWLMGWPIGWTDSEHVETESSLTKRN